MTPVNRVRPTDEVLEQMRQQVKSGEISVRQIALRMGLNRQSVHRWLDPKPRPERKSTRLCLFKQDPEGFDQACLAVARGASKISAVCKAWSCGHERVSKRIAALSGIKLKQGGSSHKRVVEELVRSGQPRKLAERAKRERLRRELEALLKQPYRVAA